MSGSSHFLGASIMNEGVNTRSTSIAQSLQGIAGKMQTFEKGPIIMKMVFHLHRSEQGESSSDRQWTGSGEGHSPKLVFTAKESFAESRIINKGKDVEQNASTRRASNTSRSDKTLVLGDLLGLKLTRNQHESPLYHQPQQQNTHLLVNSIQLQIALVSCPRKRVFLPVSNEDGRVVPQKVVGHVGSARQTGADGDGEEDEGWVGFEMGAERKHD
ncbi:hypothetical protein DFS34DRAFT_360693 [Phlyctochytrium arcticum]|nr:hypothetical protein DFS34DRAFT_360693 [Phlyctochytrium arcticum]